MSQCQFTVAGDGDGCTFRSTIGAIKLSVEGTVGAVVFEKAIYNGSALASLPAKTIAFTVVAGKTDLAVTYAFSDPVGGAGNLIEECQHTKVCGISAKERSAVYHICA